MSLHYAAATIAQAASVSDAVPIAYSRVEGLYLSAAWTAAGIGFLVSRDGTTFVQAMRISTASDPQPLTEYEILAANVPTAEAVYIPLPSDLFRGGTFVKVKSQTAGSAVAQDGARVLYFAFRCAWA